MGTDVDQLARRFREAGYSAHAGQLYSPNSHPCPAVIKDNGNVYLAAQLAEKIEAMQRAGLERGRRNLRGTIWHTVPLRF